jgi:palmitoyl-protein thioesterase
MITESVKMSLKVLILLTILSTEVLCAVPVVLWHGFGTDHLDVIKEMLQNHIDQNIYIKSIQLGETAIEDAGNGIFIHPNTQISGVCYQIMADENLKNGFHAIGFSQGSQFL